MHMQGGGGSDVLRINAVLTGQPGRVTVGLRDRSGPEGSSRLAPTSLDITLCVAPNVAQVGPFQTPPLSRHTCEPCLRPCEQ